MKSMLPAEPVLVGRDKEIKQLMRCLETALSGKGTTILILGEAGVGKTRLVNEFLALSARAKLTQEVGNPPILWQIHYSLGLLLEKRGNPQRAAEHYAEATALIKETASKLKDTSLKNILLTAPKTRAMLDTYAKTEPTQ